MVEDGADGNLCIGLAIDRAAVFSAWCFIIGGCGATVIHLFCFLRFHVVWTVPGFR